MSFCSTALSSDPRTQCILQRAIRCMTGVHTLRILLGHQRIVEGLIQGFFRYERIPQIPVRRLWIESSCIDRCYWDQRISSLVPGLESFRIRRTYISRVHGARLFDLARSHTASPLSSKTYDFITHVPETLEKAVELDSIIYTSLAKQHPSCVLEICGNASCLGCANSPKQDQYDPVFFYGVLNGQTETLTSITFDWLLNGRAVLEALTSTRPHFPRLRALQLRNAVRPPAQLEETLSSAVSSIGCYLLGPPWLDFFQRHPNLECLAWPIEYFLPHRPQSETLGDDVRDVIKTLGHCLKSLRVDARALNHHFDSVERLGAYSPQASGSQTAFIRFVASQMRSLEVIKVEGTIPIELRLELLKALKHCSLKRIVVIGVSWALAETWTDLEDNHSSHWRLDIGRSISWKSDVPSIQQISAQDDLQETQQDFEALSLEVVERPAALSILEVLALSQAGSVSELKFSGFIGAPMLYYPSPKSQVELSHLKHFHNLRYLTTAVWLSVTHEDQDLSPQILEFWNGTTEKPVQISRYLHYILKTYYSPAVLADKVAELIGPHLSAQACAHPMGVKVKALFLIQQFEHEKIFELQVLIGNKGKVISFVGMRDENHPEKLQEKMLAREWF
ncbi:hypothetical protein MMC17_009870 [Xylographa soralifera]|nr:hypothetical protein [Xylographa soralifera]